MGDIWNCSCHRIVKLVEYGMKGLKKVLEKGFIEFIVNEIQIDFMLEKGTIDAA